MWPAVRVSHMGSEHDAFGQGRGGLEGFMKLSWGKNMFSQGKIKSENSHLWSEKYQYIRI